MLFAICNSICYKIQYETVADLKNLHAIKKEINIFLFEKINITSVSSSFNTNL